ncbi:MAG: DUF1501 domain-containing protein [Limisphaera sp.]|nr:DUF1501 domain-containing protein [Limisphaera sp.]
MDRACHGLIQDLKQRGLLEDTLLIWGGDFGRTVCCQDELTRTNYGRDHPPRWLTIWMAGGGVRGGIGNMAIRTTSVTTLCVNPCIFGT